MDSIRIPEELYDQVRTHLFGASRERFAFMLAERSRSAGGWVLLVRDVLLIPDEEVDQSGYEATLSTSGVLLAVNAAAQSRRVLIEAHAHMGTRPRFSMTDEAGLKGIVPYMLSSLPSRPYVATVFAGEEVYGRLYEMHGDPRDISSIVVVGERLVQLVSQGGPKPADRSRYVRQEILISAQDQKRISRLTIGLVGAGGTGSICAMQLAYLGFRRFVVIDDQRVERSNLNRTMTAVPGQEGQFKSTLAEEAITRIAPDACVEVFREELRSRVVLDRLKGVDVLLGLGDNDGVRLILNELALAYAIPYIDLGTGLPNDKGKLLGAGGQVAVVLPGGACLLCMRLIDLEEAGHALGDKFQQAWARNRGYTGQGAGGDPSVVPLNGEIVSAAIIELIMLVTGQRKVARLLRLDVLGSCEPLPGQYLRPIRVQQREDCVHCPLAWSGEASGIERYAVPASEATP